MANLELIDEEHVRLHLGRTPVVLDLPTKFKTNGYNPDNEIEPPEQNLALEWVYGARGSDCRNNLLFLSESEELVYFMAAVVVLYNTKQHTQRHYLEHTDDVESLAIHPDQVTIASGQVAGHAKKQGRPHVRIWKADSLQTLHVIGEGDFQRSVCCIAFSSYDLGELLCVVDEANDHHLSVWDWKHEKKISQAKGSKDPILDIDFNPQESNSIVSCGRGQISFWTIDDSRNLEVRRGTFKNKEAPKYILGIAFSPKGFLVSGDSNGNILIWDKGKNKISRELTGAHTDAVFSLTFLRDGRLVSGGRAGNLVLWDETCTRKLVGAEIPSEYGAVRCIVQGMLDKLYIETTKNCLLEGTFNSGFMPLSMGHRDEIWGLCSHPSLNRFVTCSDDRVIAMRNADTFQTIWTCMIKQGAHCCTLAPDGQLLAIGCQTGHYVVIDATSGSVLHKQKVSREQIEDIKFSPDGAFLAAGSRDNSIYIFKLDNDKNLDQIGVCSGHTSYVTHIDWSEDGKLLRSNSGDYELLYWQMPEGKREFSDDVTRDLEWATWNCTLSFEVAGIWNKANDGTDVNGVCVDRERSLCISADDFGFVNAFNFPCPVKNPKCNSYSGHSSHVTSVCFLADGKTIVSVGGRDMAVLQWKLQ